MAKATNRSSCTLLLPWTLAKLPYSITPEIPRFPGNTAPSPPVRTRAWLLRSRYVAIENIIALIRVVASHTGLGQSTGEGVTETVIGWRYRNSGPILLRRGSHDFQATPRPASVMIRAWLLRLRYVAIENIITSIRSLHHVQASNIVWGRG